ELFWVVRGGPPGRTIAAECFPAHAFQAAIPSCCFASRSASGRAFHAVICGFVLLPRNTARNVSFVLMKFPFLYALRAQTKARYNTQMINVGRTAGRRRRWPKNQRVGAPDRAIGSQVLDD